MPKNRFLYIGILVVAACALLYAGKKLTDYVFPILPWVAGVGALLIVIGIFMESKAKQNAAQLGSGHTPGETAAESVKHTRV